MRLGQLTRLSPDRPREELGRAPRARSPSSRRSSPTTGRCARSSRTSWPRSRRSSPRRGLARSPTTPARSSIEDLVDDKELVVVMTEAGYVKTVDGRRRSRPRAAAAAAWPARKLKADDLVAPRASSPRRTPTCCSSPTAARSTGCGRWRSPSGSARPRACRSSTCCRWQPGETIQAIIDTRDFAGERYLFFATRQGTVKKTAFNEYDTSPARRAHRPQPARRRRAGAGHRDQRRRRHLHGQPQGHDDPLQRGRRAADGPRRGRRARHEAARRRRGRVGATSPATTPRS